MNANPFAKTRDAIVVTLSDGQQILVRHWLDDETLTVDHRAGPREVWRPVCAEMQNGEWRLE